MKLRDRLVRFMYGRYGTDELNRLLTVLFFVLWVINIFARSTVVYFLSLLVVTCELFRSLSRNIVMRRKENLVYLNVKGRVTGFFKGVKMRFRDFKVCRYRSCPKCRAKLRLPVRKGKHTAKCPRCGNEFDVKIHF